MVIPLQTSSVYGPIRSRRLGMSLGINILPSSLKYCLSSCIYCQYGETDRSKLLKAKLPTKEKIIEELKLRFEELLTKNLTIDTISICGNGEPTLHPELRCIVIEVKKLRDQYYPQASVGIFSDSGRVYVQKVRQVLEMLDKRYMKLDVGDEAMYRQLNQPIGKVDWEKMVQGLKELPNVILQSLFISEPIDNSTGEAYQNWLRTVKEIQPKEVYVYTLDRLPADKRVKAVSESRLIEIQQDVENNLGISASVF